jgi:predicted DNA repair protein MutK
LIVYGGVALIVKADDAGVALARNTSTSSCGALLRGIGRLIVKGMSGVLTALTVLGTAAMIRVGGGIIAQGLEVYGFPAFAHFMHHAAEHAEDLLPVASRLSYWLVSAIGCGLVGIVVGASLIPLTAYVVVPAIRFVSRIRERE